MRAKASVLAAVLFLISAASQAQQPTELPPLPEEAEAMRRVRALREAKGQPYYDHQRVEVTGIWSADELTDERFRDMFDKRVTPSRFRNLKLPKPEPGPLGWVKDLWRKAGPANSDWEDMKKDRNGVLSDGARTALADLEGKSVNELVCHSWGSEMIYTAILKGYIKAPARIVVLGPPDWNIEKWRALAEWTGAQVFYFKAADDSPAFAGSLGKAAISRDPAVLKAEWYKACVSVAADSYHNRCHINKDHRPGFLVDRSEDINKAGKYPGHDRLKYYDALIALEPRFGILAPDLGKAQADEVRLEASAIRSGAHLREVPVIELEPSIDTSDQLERINEGARELEARKNREHSDPHRPQPRMADRSSPPQAALDDPWDDAKQLAADACRAPDRSTQQRIDRMMERLSVYMRTKAFQARVARTCEDQVFDKMVQLAGTGKSINLGWLRSRARNKHCVEAAKDDTDLVYRGLSALARKACGGQDLGSSEIYDVFAGARTDGDSYRPLSDHSECAQEVYYLLCVGDPAGDSWEASTINQKARELASARTAPQGGDPHGGGSSNGGSDRTERLESHDFSRPNALIPTIRTPGW